MKATELPRARDLRPVRLTARGGVQGNLVVATVGEHVPFSIERVFFVGDTPAGIQRGRHAHRRHNQFFVCPAGRIEVVLDDATDRVTLVLDSPDLGLYVPPGIWAEETYVEPRTILMVLCDSPYDETDYIRDYEAFLRWRAEARRPDATAPAGQP